jgi:hypothetical protein
MTVLPQTTAADSKLFTEHDSVKEFIAITRHGVRLGKIGR